MNADVAVPRVRNGSAIGDPATAWTAFLAMLVVVEVVAASVWLDTESLRPGIWLVRLIADNGPILLRAGVVGGVVALFLRSSQTAVPAWRPAVRISMAWLAAHAAAAIAFAAISALLFQQQLDASADGPLAVAWLIAGTGLLMTAACAWSPPAAWARLLHAARHTLLAAAGLALTVSLLAWFTLPLWQPMSRATLTASYLLLRPFISSLMMDSATFRLGTPEFSVLVSRQCSGLEGLGLMLVFTSSWLWLHRREWRFPRALLLVPAGLISVWAINCVRIAVLVSIGVAGAPGVAVGGFHSQAGWLGFNAVAIGMCLAARRATWITGVGAPPAQGEASPNVTAWYLVPFLALLAAAMLARLTTETFEWTYGLRIVGVAAVLVAYRAHYREMDWRVGPMAIALGVVTFGIWMACERLVGIGTPAPMPVALGEASVAARAAWLVLRVVGATFTVPVAEELAFRGFLLRRLASEDFDRVARAAVTPLAIIGSSLVFGMLHGDRWIAGALAGAIYALAYLRRGSIGDATAAHATTNAVLAAWVLSTGAWQLW